jgi:hypothetical protein
MYNAGKRGDIISSLLKRSRSQIRPWIVQMIRHARRPFGDYCDYQAP